MTTGIENAGIDLSLIYAAYVSGAKAATTGIESGGNDLCNIFAPLSAGSANLSPMFIKSGPATLNSIFAGIGTLFTPETIQFVTAGVFSITIPTNASSMTLEIEGGGGGGGGSSTTGVHGQGGGSGGRCVSTYTITSANWGQTLTLTCGASLPSLGVIDGTGQTGKQSTVVAGTFTGFTPMTANGGFGGDGGLGGGGSGGSASGGNVTNQTGNASTAQSGATGLTGTYINGINGANGANFPGGVAQPDTATTIGQGAVHFS
jgi:hypothetical protein